MYLIFQNRVKLFRLPATKEVDTSQKIHVGLEVPILWGPPKYMLTGCSAHTHLVGRVRVWLQAHHISLQCERGQVWAQLQVPHLSQVLHIVALKVQHLQLLEQAQWAQVRDVVVGDIKFLRTTWGVSVRVCPDLHSLSPSVTDLPSVPRRSQCHPSQSGHSEPATAPAGGQEKCPGLCRRQAEWCDG